MSSHENKLTIDEVSGLTAVSPRTIRFYIQKGLVDRPVGQRKAAHYTREHVHQLLEIEKWKAAGVCPTLISDVCKHIPVICMVKRTPKIHYIFEGQKMDVTQIYSQIRKRRGRAKILANAQIDFKDGVKAKLVFVRNKHKKDWLALLTTDITLTDEDVVRIYGKR